MENIKPIRKQNICNEIFEQMKEKIIKQQWPSGTKLPSENELANRFGVSRVSIRAAIQRLIALGMIESRNGEGTFVREMSVGALMNPLLPLLALKPHDILELLEFRRGVEIVSCELAAQCATAEEVELLGQIIQEMKKSHDENNIDEYSLEDFNFHLCIAKLSKNSVIENVLNLIKDPVLAHLVDMNRRLGLELCFDYHTMIYESIRNKDGKAAAFYMEESIKRSMNKIREISLQEDLI